MRTYIITNGSALTAKRASLLLQAGLDEMRVSFYGMGADTYNAVMRGLEYDRTVEGLLRFYHPRHAEIDCKVMLYLVLPENEKDTEALGILGVASGLHRDMEAA